MKNINCSSFPRLRCLHIGPIDFFTSVADGCGLLMWLAVVALAAFVVLAGLAAAYQSWTIAAISVILLVIAIGAEIWDSYYNPWLQ